MSAGWLIVCGIGYYLVGLCVLAAVWWDGIGHWTDWVLLAVGAAVWPFLLPGKWND